MSKNYCMVIDTEGKPLSITKEPKGWFLIRKGRAELVSMTPFVVKLFRVIPVEEIDQSNVWVGIDDGSLKVGITLVQEITNKVKPLLKTEVQLRTDVSEKVIERKQHRSYRKKNKRFRPKRFYNRENVTKRGRIPPTIRNKKDSILRVIRRLMKYTRITHCVLENVEIDIRRLTEGEKIECIGYQKSNRLSENIRQAVFIRDDYTCLLCDKSVKDRKRHAHHIYPRRLGGSDSIHNLATLHETCHESIGSNEMAYYDLLSKKVKDKSKGFSSKLKYAQHVMNGKTYLQNNLKDIFKDRFYTTSGCDTADTRIMFNVTKTHSNDALCIAVFKIKTRISGLSVDVLEYLIKPLRTKDKSTTDKNFRLQCRDVIVYTKKNGTKYKGYVTSVDTKKNTINFTDFNGIEYKRYGIKRVSLISRPKGLLFTERR